MSDDISKGKQGNETTEVKYKRRERYKGTHPKSYKTKYKEHNPEKYTETINKIKQKGNTPAGMHRSIFVKEILEFLDIKPGQIGFDATLGYGGHAKEMIQCLDNKGHLYASDIDPIELAKTEERLLKQGIGPDIFTAINMNFSEIDEIVSETGKFNFILADLGVSSMQIDNPDRGFSYKTEGPLDLRMNPNTGISASTRLRSMTQEEIEGMLIENADEPHAAIIAKAITDEYKKGGQITTTSKLRNIIEDALHFLPSSTREKDIKKSCQRSFQAIRIDINHEYQVLYDFLDKLPSILAKDGKVAILSFHSGEDRLVKKSFRRYYRDGLYRDVAPQPLRPSLEEQSSNSRSKSAKLRWAIKA
jgi:16S rRNA (cytosine1402-N4)-methyltransferase